MLLGQKHTQCTAQRVNFQLAKYELFMQPLQLLDAVRVRAVVHVVGKESLLVCMLIVGLYMFTPCIPHRFASSTRVNVPFCEFL